MKSFCPASRSPLLQKAKGAAASESDIGTPPPRFDMDNGIEKDEDVKWRRSLPPPKAAALFWETGVTKELSDH